jgi:YegS/Rv2252/BmrU family lipid kinase
MSEPRPPYKSIHVIINPAAGKDEPILKTLNSTFRELNLKWEAFITKDEGDAKRFAAEAAAAGVDIVAAYGGDGTVLEVASGLRGTNVPLLILPGGTANVLSIELGVPRELPAALSLLSDPTAVLRAIDMGEVEGKLFFHMGIGFEAKMVLGADRENKNRSGFFAYISSALKNLRNPPTANYAMLIDGQHVEAQGINCMITNFGSVGVAGLTLSKTIDFSDGLLDVIVIQDINLGAVLSAAAGAITSGDISTPLLQWQGREITIVADPPQSVTRDGEIVELKNITARVVPGAIQTLVPGASVT